jgi:hypothetical protein
MKAKTFTDSKKFTFQPYLVNYVNLKHFVCDSFWETNPLRIITNNMNSRCLTPNLNPEF